MKFTVNIYTITGLLLCLSESAYAATADTLDGGTTETMSVGRSSAELVSPISTASAISCADAVAVRLSPLEIKSQGDFEKGLEHLFGKGGVQSDVAAVWSFQRASDNNHAWAKVYLSFCYLTGRGILIPHAGADKQRANALLWEAIGSSSDQEASLVAGYILREYFETLRKRTVRFGMHAVAESPGAFPAGVRAESKQVQSLWMAYFGDRHARFVHGIRP
jgi:hypothetical protein